MRRQTLILIFECRAAIKIRIKQRIKLTITDARAGAGTFCLP